MDMLNWELYWKHAVVDTPSQGPREPMLTSGTWKHHRCFLSFTFCSTAAACREENLLAVCSLSWSLWVCVCGLIFAIRTPRPEVDLQRLAFTVLSSPSEYIGYTQVKGVEDMPAIHGYTHTHTRTPKPRAIMFNFQVGLSIHCRKNRPAAKNNSTVIAVWPPKTAVKLIIFRILWHLSKLIIGIYTTGASVPCFMGPKTDHMTGNRLFEVTVWLNVRRRASWRFSTYWGKGKD